MVAGSRWRLVLKLGLGRGLEGIHQQRLWGWDNRDRRWEVVRQGGSSTVGGRRARLEAVDA
jgi:hypothetical protein